MKRYKIRFHLGRGENFQKWQVFDRKYNDKKYYDPAKVSILMKDCVLGNRPATARKIMNGEHKTVCAWVACEDYQLWDTDVLIPNTLGMTQYKYNPKKNPHWFTDRRKDVDNMRFQELTTIDRRIYG